MTTRAHDVLADDGVRLYVETRGERGEAVIVPNRVFMADALARLADRFRLVLFDPRNRGRSETIPDAARLEGGVTRDVDDIDAIRRHFGFDTVSLIGHSYMGVVVVLYARRHPDWTNRVVQIGAMGPDAAVQYPVHLTNSDATLADVLAEIAALEHSRAQYTPDAFCRRFWAALRRLYVADANDADRLGWEPCDLPNERAFRKQFAEHILPSLQRLKLTPADFAAVRTPVLGIHGRQDRSAPYGAGRDWVLRLPNARLLTVEGAAHVPWIEEPGRVLGAIERFLDGSWPEAAEAVTALDLWGEAG